MEQTINVEEVKKEYQKTGKQSLKRLLDSAEKLSQGKVFVAEFDAAKKVKECERCHKEIRDGELCRACKDEDVRKRQAEILKTKWENLEESLNEVSEANNKANKYVLHIGKYISDSEIRLQRGEHWVSIYRTSIMTSEGWYVSSHALRIKSSNYDVKKSGLKKDFGHKELAESFNKLCDEMLDEIIVIEKQKKDVKKTENVFEENIRRLFGEGIESIESHFYRSSNGRYEKTSSKDIVLKNGLMMRSSINNKFSVTKLPIALNAEQILQLSKFIEQMQK